MDEDVATRIRFHMSEAKYSQRALAQAVDLEETKLAKALGGSRNFSAYELAAIAEEFGVTVEWLLHGRAPSEMMFSHRAHAVDTSALDEVGVHILASTQERYQGLRRLGLLSAPRSLPTATNQWSYVARSEALAQATLTMASFQVRGASNSKVFDFIESTLDINVIATRLPADCDGLSYATDDFRAIVVGTTDVAVRQRYTAAHELGHLLWGDASQLVVSDDPRSRPAERLEKQANTFAANFLMPENEIVETLGKKSAPSQFDELTWAFGVAPAAMAWRLFNLKMINSKERTLLGSRTTVDVARRLGRLEDHLARNTSSEAKRPPLKLAMTAVEGFLAGDLSAAIPAELLGITSADVRRLFDSEQQIADWPADAAL